MKEPIYDGVVNAYSGWVPRSEGVEMAKSKPGDPGQAGTFDPKKGGKFNPTTKAKPAPGPDVGDHHVKDKKK